MITGLIGTISTVMVSTITESEMYWLTRMSHLHSGVFWAGFFIAIAAAVSTMLSLCIYADVSEKDGIKLFIPSIICLILSILVAVSSAFIPTTKEMCAIKAIPVIVNNEQVQELPNKVIELANEWIDELKPSKENQK